MPWADHRRKRWWLLPATANSGKVRIVLRTGKPIPEPKGPAIPHPQGDASLRFGGGQDRPPAERSLLKCLILMQMQYQNPSGVGVRQVRTRNGLKNRSRRDDLAWAEVPARSVRLTGDVSWSK